MKKAVIAIGSNSTRMLVAECGAHKRLDIICRARKSTRLLMRMENGVITPGGIDHVSEDVKALYADARAQGAKSVDLIATSATRDAKNSDALAKKIINETGLTLQILSGEEEARLAYLAVSGGGDGIVIDIGGGSTEITVGDNGQILMNESARIGSSRLLNEFGEIRSLDDAMTVLAAARERLLALTGKAGKLDGRRLYGIGGTGTTAANIYMRGGDAEGVLLTRDEVERQLCLIAPMTGDERAALPGLPASRVSHMPHGLCILLAAMDALGAKRLTVSERTNMDGFLLSR